MRCVFALGVLLLTQSAHAFLGTELGPLLQLVSGQVREIERLSEQVGIAKDQRDLLIRLNEGIDQTVSQIQNLHALIDRAQGLDPRGVKSISELNEYLTRVKEAKRSVDEVLGAKTELAGLVVGQSGIQSETAYLMGQEMIAVGSKLAQESETASPGRAEQITAASTSAQMLATGVELQTLAQIAQLQAMQLELQRSQIQALLDEKKSARLVFEESLTHSKQKGRKL